MRIVLVLAVLLAAGVAGAQGIVDVTPAQEAPSDFSGWVIFVSGMLVPIAYLVLQKVAPLTDTKIDDQARDFLKRLMDPNDPQSVPTPKNPTGVEK